MPVEIRTLVIKAIYRAEKNSQPAPAPLKMLTEDLKIEIVEACVAQIMDKLEKKQRR